MATSASGSVKATARPGRPGRGRAVLSRRVARLLLPATLARWGCLPARTGAATDGGAATGADVGSWPQWRGPLRNGIVPSLPDRLSRLRLVWTLPTSSPGLGGIAATSDMAVVVDHAGSDDVYRAVDLSSGEIRWECRRPNKTDVDFGPCPRATPLLADGRVFVLGAGGDLACLDASTGTVRWSRDLRRDFGTAELPTWGFCGSPLLVDGRLIVNPGASAGTVVALNPATGETVWASPGRPANYSSLMAGVLGGVHQVIGYDSGALCQEMARRLGSAQCRDLCGLDLTQAEGLQKLAGGVKRERCAPVVREAARLLAEELNHIDRAV